MACVSLGCNNGLFVTPENLRVYVGKTNFFVGNGAFRCNSFGSPSVGFYQCYKSHVVFWNRKVGSFPKDIALSRFPSCCKYKSRFTCDDGIEPLLNKSRGKGGTHFVEGESNRVRKRFSLRLRPRLRLLAMRLKKISVRSILNGLRALLRKNMKRVTVSTLISLALGFCYMFLQFTASPSPKVVPYSDLIVSLQNGSVTKVLLEEGSRRIYYNVNSEPDRSNTNQISPNESPAVDVTGANQALSDDNLRTDPMKNVNLWRKSSRTSASVPAWLYCTRKIDHDEKFLVRLMREKGVTYSSAPQSLLMSMRSTLITVLTLWIPLSPLMWLLYRQLLASNSLSKKRKPNGQMVGFEDVEGVDAAKLELMEIVSCLQGTIFYKKLGAKLPRGVLLVGPPGTGKTLLARAVAGEAGVPFFSVSASEFVELFVGRGAARIRDLFNAARKCSPSIIFIDELDAVGGKRGRSFNDERDQTLNQLLTEMDGFEPETKVIVIAATNRPEALDPALCRPGRFSRKVVVGEPDEEGRRKILAVHLRGVPLEEDTDIICHLVASLTPGFVGADLANIVNEAALLAARRGGETVTREDIMEAIERAKFGINDKQLKPSRLGKELGKLFPWVPSLMGRDSSTQDKLEGPLGYQTLS